MIGRSLCTAAALLSGFIASQAPEFAQQYRQRLGGAVDELGLVVTTFDRDAADAGMDRSKAVAAMKSSENTLVHLRGASVEAAIHRYDRLRAQYVDFERSGSLGRVTALFASPDQPLVRATFDHYEPAVPTTLAGIVTASLGFLLAYLVLGPLAWLLRPGRSRRRKRPERPERRRWSKEEESF